VEQSKQVFSKIQLVCPIAYEPPHKDTMTQDSFLQSLSRARIVGILRASSADDAVNAARAAMRAGLGAIELTFTTPKLEQALETLRSELPDGVLLGAGTVLDAAQALLAVESGAQFLVSPHLGEDILELALEWGIPYTPGVLTPTEIVRARRLGASVLKLFPVGSSGGLAYVKDLLGPFPDLELMVTGGVKPEQVGEYLRAGVRAVGLGGNLFPKSALEQRDWNAVEQATRRTLEQVFSDSLEPKLLEPQLLEPQLLEPQLLEPQLLKGAL
jgi:2-dehydro-3-deoxyphosphogluconate aldolase / (4S)-4-hydroxy-2-oxoglutarate aldolase